MDVFKTIIEFVMDILETVVFVCSLFMVTYLFIFQPNQIKGASMEPTFYSGQYIFTSKVTYKMRTPERGDVIVLESPKNNEIEYIKRIIGLPGDVVMIKDTEVYLNGKKLNEPYISAKSPLWEGGFVKEGVPFTVPDGDVFVMGDNRPRSQDGREFGPIPISTIIGQVFYRYFPTSQMGPIHNPWPKDTRTRSSGEFTHKVTQNVGGLLYTSFYFYS